MMMYVGPDSVSVVDHNNAGRDGGGTATGVDFSNCSLRHASFSNAKLDNVNFTGALLEGAKFKGARLKNPSFKGAVLTGVNLKELEVPEEALEGCVTDVSQEARNRAPKLRTALATHHDFVASNGRSGAPASLDGEDLRPLKGEFAGRVLAALSLHNVRAIGVDFSRCQLQAAKFDGADLRAADFSGADLRGASFKGARLAHARFDGANLGSLPIANGAALKADLTDTDALVDQFAGALLDAGLSDLGLPAAR